MKKKFKVKWLVIFLVSLIIADSLFMGYKIFKIEYQLAQINALTNTRQKCNNYIDDFMEGSDYLTTQIWFYVTTRDKQYMDNYWNEVNVTRSRDIAIENINELNLPQEYLSLSENAKSESDALINLELWAMRMISESVGMSEKEMPDDVAAYKLSNSDKALSPQEKRDKSVGYIYGDPYSISKHQIINLVNKFRQNTYNYYADVIFQHTSDINKNTFMVKIALLVNLVTFIALIVTVEVFLSRPLRRVMEYIFDMNSGDTEKDPPRIPAISVAVMEFLQSLNILMEKYHAKSIQLERINEFDLLTNLLNREKITNCAEELLRTSQNSGGVMIVDIDLFDKFNDRYGHIMGDYVLIEMSKIFESIMSRYNIKVGRLSGKQFLIVMPDYDSENMSMLAQLILTRVRAHSLKAIGILDSDIGLSVSIGGALWDGAENINALELIHRANRALYDAKTQGRDRFVFYGG